jgi:hypothetical protein
MNENDKKIFELKEKLKERKELLGEKPISKLRTNCNISMFGTMLNIHAMNEFELNILFSWLKQLNNPELKIGEYKIKDFLSDILDKIVSMDYQKQISEIKKLESQLDNLISAETKTSIEIDKLAALIKGEKTNE